MSVQGINVNRLSRNKTTDPAFIEKVVMYAEAPKPIGEIRSSK